MKETKDAKIETIQGMRGLAILGVVSYHFLFGEFGFLPSKYGYFGVQLFFCISGFVVFRSVISTDKLIVFMRKRFSRIYPTLTLVVIVNFLVSYITRIPELVHSNKPINLIASLTLIDPNLLHHFFRSDFDYTLGILWSLTVEAYFYLGLGLTFFLLKRDQNKTFLFFLTLMIFSQIFSFLSQLLPSNSLVKLITGTMNLFGIQYLPWFLLGMFLNLVISSNRSNWNLLILTVAFSVSQTINTELSKNGFDIFAIVISFITAIFFVISSPLFKAFSNFLSLSLLQEIGNSSYELYLIHTSIAVVVNYYIPQQVDESYRIIFNLFLIPATIITSIFLERKITSKIGTFMRNGIEK